MANLGVAKASYYADLSVSKYEKEAIKATERIASPITRVGAGERTSLATMEDQLRLDVATKNGAIRSMSVAQGYLKATENALDGGSYILKKLHDLAVEASNDKATSDELAALDLGAELLGDEFHKHMTTANYKGKPVFGIEDHEILIGTGLENGSIKIGVGMIEYDDLYDHINPPENSITSGVTYEITKPLSADQKETILSRTSGITADDLVVGAQFTVLPTSPSATGPGIRAADLYYADGDGTVIFDPTAIASSAGDFKSGYLDIRITNNAEFSDDFNIVSGNGAPGSIVRNGNTISYVDPTHGSIQIGQIEGANHGQNGTGLRINFFDQIVIPNSSNILNGDFSNGLTNWTAYLGRVDFGSNFLLADGSSIPTPTDAQMAQVDYTQGRGVLDPSVVGNDNVGISNPSSQPSFSATIINGELKLAQGSYNVDLGYGIVHGPAAVSDSFSATTGDILRLDYKAQFNIDDYHVAGYIFNTDTNEITLAINETGYSASGTKTIEISQDGNYRFVFVNGTFDKSGLRGVGADFFIDNIESENPYSIPDTAIQQLLRSTSYSSSSNNQQYVKDVSITANDGVNTLSDTSKIFNTEYEGKIMVAPTLDLEKPVSTGASNNLGPGGTRDPYVVVSKVEEVKDRIELAKAIVRGQYEVLDSAIDAATDLRAEFFWGKDAISNNEAFADTAYFAKQQIMQDSAAAILAQANKSQNGLMKLVN